MLSIKALSGFQQLPNEVTYIILNVLMWAFSSNWLNFQTESNGSVFVYTADFKEHSEEHINALHERVCVCEWVKGKTVL